MKRFSDREATVYETYLSYTDNLIDLLNFDVPMSREASLVKTKLDEAQMWFGKAIELHGVKDD